MSCSITTVNVNGIRAAVKQRSESNLGMIDWLARTAETGHPAPDIIAMQEVRASEAQARAALAPLLEDGWSLVMSESEVKPGHAGVGVLSRSAPVAVRPGFGSAEFDPAGRYLEADFDTDLGRITVGSLYLPKGGKPVGDEAEVARHDEKVRFLKEFGDYLDELAGSADPAVVLGDWNIAPDERDIKNWKGNLRNPGFLPHEREWVARRLATGWTDVTRGLHPEQDGPYSWWSWRGKAFDNDAGWRIDYHLVNEALAPRAVASAVSRADAYNLRWSDHAPVTVTFA